MTRYSSIYNSIYNNIIKNIINYLFYFILFLFYFHSLRSLTLTHADSSTRQVRAQIFENICVNVQRVGPSSRKSSTIFKTGLDFQKIYYTNFKRGLTI